MTSVAPPICGGCKHLDRTSDRPLFDPKCTAFPAEVPRAILLSEVDHRKPYAGDNGIVFEPQDKDAADYAAMIFDGE
jgi:hypothetical protein